ncbi:hypothetical protein BGZ60DRAFT_196731 [Tricladium varicosporioides]|nr:hypothetical protein BGZ60DRAFT_196731 [Hymenoscyphus varicosporioides]
MTEHQNHHRSKRSRRARDEDDFHFMPKEFEEEPLLINNLPTLPQSFQEIGVTELLEQDSRPTFVLDLQPSEAQASRVMNVVFCNKSLRFFDSLRKVVLAETFYPTPPVSSDPSPPSQGFSSLAEVEFREWATSVCDWDGYADGYLPRHTFRGMYWSSATLRKRWRIISASQVPNQRRQSHGTPRSSRSSSRSTSTSRSSACDTDTTEEDSLQQQLADSESKFRVLTELNPVGMYYLSPDGNILYANDMWYEITGHPRGLEGEMSFMNVISESSHPKITEEWETLTTKRGRRVFELKLRHPWIDETTGEARQKWILASCDQEFDEFGNLKSIMGCITDISAQKHIEASAVERANLIEKLALRTQEAEQHERNFQQMAELAPCGMFTLDDQGTITWANPQWYEMTGHPRNAEEHYPMSFLNSIEIQDHKAFRTGWESLTIAKEEVTAEFRLKKPWVTQDHDKPVRDSTWILFLGIPQLDGDGNVTKVLGCTTDISHFKWAESVQLKSRLQAEEAKKQQESFIDMTSHEMRNPLSAITLCADGIANSLMEYKAAKDRSAILSDELIDDNLEAAQTIVICAQHQKRIIDDVLTLSKLNAAMLQVTPAQVQIEQTVRRTLKMFAGELQDGRIMTTFVVEPAFNDTKIDWVFCDPVRLTQVFINLLTNAIKFTKPEDVRHIKIYLSASVGRPPRDTLQDIQWFPSKDCQSKQDLTLSPEWGTGQPVYLYFAIRDTGRGLDEDEKSKLFHRFSQANPRTHVQYGGSGLGLFISRELTELQGGEIGVASKAGKGSVFAFYIKARRSTGPQLEGHLSSKAEESGTTIDSPIPHLLPLNLSRPRRNYHILLVEDNLINQKVLSKQLRTVGCTVHVANHGGEALDFLSRTTLWKASASSESDPGHQNQKIDLTIILMDLEMPIMDGLTAARAIRDLEREGKITHVPIIAVTANTRLEQIEVALEAGMDDIVPKPFHIPDLMQKADKFVSIS